MQASRAEQELDPIVQADQIQEDNITEPAADQDLAGSCSRNLDQTRLLVNFIQGYCLRYPAEYDVSFLNSNQIMFFKYSILNHTEPNAYIEVQPAGGMTVEQAAEQILAVYGIPDVEIPRIEMSLGGEKAIMLDGLSGQDPNRQVVVLHKDTLYTLYFMQMDKNQPEMTAQAETLYDTVIQSFNFRLETNTCPDCQPLSDLEEDQTQEDLQTASISGWLQHDLCDSGKDGEPQLTTTPPGCVQDDHLWALIMLTEN